MSELIIRRIKSYLAKEFDGLINLSDLKDKSHEDQENHFLTRSQAACVLAFVAEIDKKAARMYN